MNDNGIHMDLYGIREDLRSIITDYMVMDCAPFCPDGLDTIIRNNQFNIDLVIDDIIQHYTKHHKLEELYYPKNIPIREYMKQHILYPSFMKNNKQDTSTMELPEDTNELLEEINELLGKTKESTSPNPITNIIKHIEYLHQELKNLQDNYYFFKKN